MAWVTSILGFRYFFFIFTRPCVSVHFLGPLIQFSISFLHCLLSVCIIVLASVPHFYSINFPYVIPVRSSHHAGLCHIVFGVLSFLCRFHVHMVIVDVGDIARLVSSLYLLFCIGFSSHLIPFHLYRCSPHLHLWRDLQFGNVILVHQHIERHVFFGGFFRQYHLLIFYHFPFIVPNLYSCYLPHFFSTLI